MGYKRKVETEDKYSKVKKITQAGKKLSKI